MCEGAWKAPRDPHCGIRSQCVDRRFGSLAAGLEEHDLVEKYGVDIFLDSLDEGDPRTQAESHIRFAIEIHSSSDDDLFGLRPISGGNFSGHILPCRQHSGQSSQGNQGFLSES